jgi:hypothetical protein
MEDHDRKRVFMMWEEDQKEYDRMEEMGYQSYLNLGRLYASKGMLLNAAKEFQQALEICPGEPSCTAALHHVQKMLN